MGNIIGMLAGELMSGSSVKQVAKAAGVNEKQAENLMGNAIPLLVQAMSDNAGTKVGAESLYEALGQHSNGLSAAEQLDRADLEDGDRIIGKILGDNKQGVTEALAKQAGVTKGNSAKILALLAPVILSLISTETNTNNTSSGGLSSLLSLFTDATQATATRRLPPALASEISERHFSWGRCLETTIMAIAVLQEATCLPPSLAADSSRCSPSSSPEDFLNHCSGAA